ncbi:bacterioferritin [Gammaproteobacteria bacterium]|nr:bacterioferritin [Gammaproteobacteria bacterium]
MDGSKKVIQALNLQLITELSTADQYMMHAHLCKDWGLNALFTHMEHERGEEILHAQMLADRILFLNGTPDTAARVAINCGADVKSMLENDLQAEYDVAAMLKKAIVICESEHDFVSRDLLLKLLDDTESDHAHWLEQQLNLINLMGIQNYLQSQM